MNKGSVISLYQEIIEGIVTRFHNLLGDDEIENLFHKLSVFFPELHDVEVESGKLSVGTLEKYDSEKIIDAFDTAVCELTNYIKAKTGNTHIINEIDPIIEKVIKKHDVDPSLSVLGGLNRRFVSTGIDNLDKKLGGGFLSNSVILVIGSAGTGKDLFGYQFVHENVLRGSAGLIFTSNQSVEDIIDLMGIERSKLEKLMALKKFTFVDNYSWKLGVKSNEKYPNLLSSDGSVTDIAVSLENAINFLRPRYVCASVDILTEFLVEFGIKKVFSICETLFPVLRRSKSSVVFTIEIGAAPERDINVLKMLADSVIILREKEVSDNIKLQMLVEKFRGRTRIFRWLPYTFKNERIVIEEWQ